MLLALLSSLSVVLPQGQGPPAIIEDARCSGRTIQVEGHGDRWISLVELSPWQPDGPADGEEVASVPPGPFRVTFQRTRADGLDRAFARWLPVDSATGVPVGDARYARVIAPGPTGAPHRPRSRKGLGGITLRPDHMGDLDELGVTSITVNVVLPQLFAPKPGPGTVPHSFAGRSFHLRSAQLERLDNLLAESRSRDLHVYGILLVPRALADPGAKRLWVHPDAQEPGIYSMANLANPSGTLQFAAAVDALTARYGPDAPGRGRIHDWIVHNEVDAGRQWTNAGDRSLESYVELYHRVLRVVHAATRRRAPHGRVFVPLTHHWAKTVPGFYPAKELLLELRTHSARGGDFDWGVALHPYPSNLRDPRAWLDQDVDLTFDTPKITPRNLEVIDRWMQRDDFLFAGRPRGLIFSEQGPNAPSLDEGDQQLQAAGIVYFWRQCQGLETLESFQLHRWVDHAHEGGLRLGLRANAPGTASTPGARKAAFDVFRSLGAEDELEACALVDALIELDRSTGEGKEPPASRRAR